MKTNDMTMTPTLPDKSILYVYVENKDIRVRHDLRKLASALGKPVSRLVVHLLKLALYDNGGPLKARYAERIRRIEEKNADTT